MGLKNDEKGLEGISLGLVFELEAFSGSNLALRVSLVFCC